MKAVSRFRLSPRRLPRWHVLSSAVFLLAAMSLPLSCKGESGENKDNPSTNSGKSANAAPGMGGMGGFRTSTNVEVVRAAMGAVASYQVANGTLDALQRAPVFARVGEVCLDVLVQEGDAVKAGQELARLHGARLANQRDKVQASVTRATQRVRETKLEYDKAQSDYERLQKVVAEGLEGEFLSKDEIDRARVAAEKANLVWEASKADLSSANADLGDAMLNVEHAVIRAPISGIVASRKLEPFDLVKVDQELFVIAVLESLRLRTELPETASPLLRRPARSEEGTVDLGSTQAVLLASTAYPGDRFLGYVELVSPVITDPERGMLGVTIRVVQPSGTSNPEYAPLLAQFPPVERTRILESSAKAGGAGVMLLPGNFIEASIVTSFKSDALVIPSACFVDRGVYVVNDAASPVTSATDGVGSTANPPVGTTQPVIGTDTAAGENKGKRSKRGDKGGAGNGSGGGGGSELTVRRVDLAGFIGISSEGYAEILPGGPLKEGDQVVVRGQEYLKDGAPVKIVGPAK